MPIIGSLVGGIGSGIAGLFGGGKQQKVQTNGTITNNSSTTGGYSSSTNPNFTPLQNALINQFTTGASNLYNQSTNLQPYEASGLEQINSGSNAAGKSIAANLASMGQSFSPAAASANTQNILSRTGQQAQFANSIPLLQRQLQQQALGQLTQAFSVIPTGQTSAGTTSSTSSGTQTQQGTNLVSGNPLAGATSGAVSGGIAGYGLGNLYNSMNGGSSNASSPVTSGSSYLAPTNNEDGLDNYLSTLG